MFCLKFFVEVAGGARDVDAARNAALAVLHALDDACGFAALGTVSRLRRVHYFLAVAGLCNLCHGLFDSPLGIVSAHARHDGGGFNGAVWLLGSEFGTKRKRDSLSTVYNTPHFGPIPTGQWGWLGTGGVFCGLEAGCAGSESSAGLSALSSGFCGVRGKFVASG